MRRRAFCLAGVLSAAAARAQTPQPRVLLFFSLNVEADHMLFAADAIRYFAEAADKHDFRVEATSNWADMNDENLKQYKLIVCLNNTPQGAQQEAFQRYMEGGGAWLGFHFAGFNMGNSRWTWFRQFLGGAAFATNSWPPLPAKLVVDDVESPITRGLPKSFQAPVNEWYSWRPSPRLDKDVRVLLSLEPSQFPLGIKSMITQRDPDVPVVWTNTRFKMLYMNIGHGDKIFTSPIQNKLIENGLLWLLGKS